VGLLHFQAIEQDRLQARAVRQLKVTLLIVVLRFPRSVAAVMVDRLEILYLAGFALLHLVVTALPLLSRRTVTPALAGLSENTTYAGRPVSENQGSSLEFLPLLLTSVYCAIGLIWAFVRLGYAYVSGLGTTVE
jgi:alpha-1,3-glucosyltransferase